MSDHTGLDGGAPGRGRRSCEEALAPPGHRPLLEVPDGIEGRCHTPGDAP